MAGHRGTFSHFAWIAFVVLWFACAIYIFINGFLLSRREINLKSTCDNERSNKNATAESTCWIVPDVAGSYKKVVIVVIDALRTDFALYQPNLMTEVPYLNKLKVFKDLADEYGCSGVRLFKFRADAPTTTMQRIKGMTTGSFPTFIDVSNNFDSSEISEDNFIDQILKDGTQNITFLGDDTWLKLFPGRFSTAFPFPSFDVKDLHLVDNGIIKHLVPQLKRDNWKLLIAHFLGVDHCGHRYGPLHSQMAAKLNQMDSVLRSVVKEIDQDTLLLVMGDHGMTQTGDHGGETIEEIDSALFAFSPSQKFSNPDKIKSPICDAGLVHQIDIVPSLSLLLGTPIPYSNLGSVIVDLIPGNPQLHEALLINAKQIETYLKEYLNRYSDIKSRDFLELIDKFSEVDEKELSSEELQSLLRSARDLCKQMWAKFDEKLMTFGACLLSSMCLTLFLPKPTAVLSVSTPIFCLSYIFLPAQHQHIVLLGVVIILFLQLVFWSVKRKISLLGLPCFLFPLTYFSNSFVVNEDVMVKYVYSSVVSMYFLQCLSQSYLETKLKRLPKLKKSSRLYFKFKQALRAWSTQPSAILTSLITALLVSIRFAFLFRTCRPEQFWCFGNQTSDSSKTTGYLIDDYLDFNDHWIRLLVSGGSLVALCSCVRYLMKREGNLRTPYSAAVLCMNRFLPLAIVFIIANWQLHTASSKKLDSLPVSVITFFPRCAYFLLSIAFLWWIYQPLSMHILYRDKYGQFRDKSSFSNDDIISLYFKQLKQRLDDDLSKQQNKNALPDQPPSTNGPDFGQPVAFGMYTLLSSALLGLGTVLILFGAMLLEERFAFVLFMFVLSTWLFLELHSAISNRHSQIGAEVPFHIVGMWTLSCSFWWFATGHQASLSSIPWNAAFVGFRGNHFTVILPAIMVGANIFISHILHTVFLPLLLLWPVTRGKWFSKTNESTRDCVKSEFEFVQSTRFWNSFTDLLLKHILMHALKVLSCTCVAFLHRRHLMVWQIFAPRFVYEVLAFSVVCGTSFFMFLFTVVFKRKLRIWIKQNINFSTN